MLSLTNSILSSNVEFTKFSLNFGFDKLSNDFNFPAFILDPVDLDVFKLVSFIGVKTFHISFFQLVFEESFLEVPFKLV